MEIPSTSNCFLIAGEWRTARTNQTIDIENPANEEIFASVASASASDVDDAVAAALRAFASYSRWSVEDRIELLLRIANELAQRRERIAELVTAEMGAPAAFARSFHADGAASAFKSMAAVLRDFRFEHSVPGALLVHEPIGVCGLIVPWNAPVSLLATKTATALAAGCTVVAKPSEISPLSSLIFSEALVAAGVPAGVFNLVNGEGGVAGQRLAEHPNVDLISITGSTRAGRLVAIAAAESVKRVHQELGGKSANIILPDADLDKIVPIGVARSFVGGGQSCQAPTRMLVPRASQGRALELAAAAANSVRVGDPLDPLTDMGPLAYLGQYYRAQVMIEAGVAGGATLAAGGLGRPEGLERGHYVRPTIFGNVTPDSQIAQEEIFGPVLSIIPYDEEAEAVAIANSTNYGLAGWVWSPDDERARSVARQLRTGRVYINGAPPVPNIPFGGYRQSGNGREQGPLGLMEYLEVKALLGY